MTRGLWWWMQFASAIAFTGVLMPGWAAMATFFGHYPPWWYYLSWALCALSQAWALSRTRPPRE